MNVDKSFDGKKSLAQKILKNPRFSDTFLLEFQMQYKKQFEKSSKITFF